MEKHRTVLGALFLGLGIMGAIGMLAVLVIFSIGTIVLGNVAIHEPDFPDLVAWLPLGFGIFIGLLIALSTVPSLVAGFGLLAGRPWAPVFSLIAGVLNLPIFPLGTGVGFYAIWVYLFMDSESANAPVREATVLDSSRRGV